MSENEQEQPKRSIITRITDALFTEEANQTSAAAKIEREKSKLEKPDQTNPADEPQEAEDFQEAPQESLERITEEIEKFDWNSVLDDIRKTVESEGDTITKFMNLVESLEDVIPEEANRYRAAYKALVTTSGRKRGDILDDTNRQLNSLKSQKEVFTKTVNTWRKRLQAFSDRSKEIRRDINVLQEKLRALEKQERKILDTASDKERQIRSAEVKFGDFLRDIEQDINDFTKRIMQTLPKD